MSNKTAEAKKITDFLSTKRSKEDLTIALEILREFMDCESNEEWLAIPFAAWAKIEQLEEFLDHLVNDAPLKEDTINYMDA